MLATIKKRATFVNICLFLCLALVLNMGTAYREQHRPLEGHRQRPGQDR